MIIKNDDDSVMDDDYENWFEKVFTNEGTDESVRRIRDIFDSTDNFEYLGCNQDLSKVIFKTIQSEQ